eukprot:1785-Heterococcus_DN1.PRE.11
MAATAAAAVAALKSIYCERVLYTFAAVFGAACKRVHHVCSATVRMSRGALRLGHKTLVLNTALTHCSILFSMLPRVPLAALALCWAQPASSMLSTNQIRRASSVAFSAVVRSQTALAKSATHSFGGHYQNICDLRMFSNSTACSSKHTARTCTTASAVDTSSSTATRATAADSDKLHTVYAQVCDKLREVERLSGVSAVLGWDEQVMMPSGGASARSMQKSALAGVIYEKRTAPALGELLQQLQHVTDSSNDSSSNFNKEQLAVIRDAVRDYALETRKSKDMASKESELEGKAYHAWVAARKANDWSTFGPILSEVVELKKAITAATRPEMTAYNGNIDQFERGMSQDRLTEIFNELRAGLAPLLQAIIAKHKQADSTTSVQAALQSGPQWDVKQQQKLCSVVAEQLGFSMANGRYVTLNDSYICHSYASCNS